MSKKSRARAAAKAASYDLLSAKKTSAAVVGPSVPPSRLSVALAGAVVVLAALAAYHNSFSGPFIMDDSWAITDNPTIKHLGSALSPPSNVSTSGRPILNFTFALNYALGGTNVWGYHALNLFIHALAGLTLFGIARRTLCRPALNERFGTAALPLALAVAVIWVVHPLQTQAVTYISERAESLMGLFYLLTLYGFIRSADSLAPACWQIASVLACFFGVMSKEIIVTAPVIVLLYDRAFVAGSIREAWRRHWPYYLGLASSWLLLARLMTGLHQRGVGFGEGVTWWDYALTSFRSVALYLKLTVWPHPLVLDYGGSVAGSVVHHAIEVLPYILVLAVFVVATVLALWRWPMIGFAGAWFFAILSPTSSVIPVAGQPMAESRVYLSLAAVIGLVVIGLNQWLGRRSLFVCAAAAIGLGWLTVQRNADYRSKLSIWSDTVKKCPSNARAHLSLGNTLRDQGRSLEAITEFQAAVQIEPNYVDAHNNLGIMLEKIPGRLQDAIAQYEAAARCDPNSVLAHNNLGALLATVPGRLPEAISECEKAIRIKPGFAAAHNNLGFALSKTPGRAPDAISEYEAALRINPDYPEAHYNLGNALVAVPNRLRDAIYQYETALRLKPDYSEAASNLIVALSYVPSETPDLTALYDTAMKFVPNAAILHVNLANALSTLPGKLPNAIAEYKEASRIQPNLAEAHYNLANALVSVPGRLPEAIVEYEEALQLKPDFAEAHVDLAYALSHVPGHESEAIAHLRTALKLKPDLPVARQMLNELTPDKMIKE